MRFTLFSKLTMFAFASTVSLQALAINLIDNQPIPDADCPITDISHTEDASGESIGVRNYGCKDDGVNVVWSVSVPKVCETEACGLIIDIHGAAMNAEIENSGSKLRQYGWKAKDRGAAVAYIVAQPNFTDLFDEEIGLDIFSVFGDEYLNELPSMEAFIADLNNKFNIDSQRIHMYGFSRGTHTTNVFYCDAERRAMYASFSMHAEKLKCDVQDNYPLLLTNGVLDFFTPNQQSQENTRVMTELREENYVETVLVSEDDWRNQKFAIVWSDWFPQFVWLGQYEQRRFIKGDKWFESIEHSGSSIPLVGHCLPITDGTGFLTCHSTFDIGAKVIDFFIAHPKLSS